MSRVLVAYVDLTTNKVFVDSKLDFKAIRFTNGYDNFKVIDEKTCFSKKQEREFEKKHKK